MHPLLHRRSRRWPALALVVAAACAVVACDGGSARASCGDWLEGHVPSGVHESAFAQGVGMGAETAPFHLPGKRPCNGPSCGRAPHVPLAPSEAPAVSPDLERDAILAHSDPDPLPGKTRMTGIEKPLLRSAHRGRPERPPRPS